MPDLQAYILCPQASTHPLYAPWCSRISHVVVEEYDQDWTPPPDCGVVISHLHYDFPTATILKKLVASNQVPVLVLADGVLEFRNTFENPQVSAGSLFMPVHGHKIACIGPSQARQIAAWGNAGKTEVVGLPRLDDYRQRKNNRVVRPHEPASKESDSVRVLVVTARQPGFTPRQLQLVQESLVDLRNWFAHNPARAGRTLQPVWRLTGGLEERIGVSSDPDQRQQPIADVLATVDAVISTPSTTVVESLLMDLPTAILDYTNSPKYLAAAWNITSREQIAEVVPDLLTPSAAHLDFQRNSLADTLQLNEPATDRLVRLIELLIDQRRRALENASTLVIPDRLLDPAPEIQSSAKRAISLEDLFPCQIGFRATESQSLATEYGQISRTVRDLQEWIDRQREEIFRLRQEKRIAWRNHDLIADQFQWLRAEIRRLQVALRIRNREERGQRRIRFRASIAFQRWEFFVVQVGRTERRKSGRARKGRIRLDCLFELTGHPKAKKIPVTVQQYQPRHQRRVMVRMWRHRPTRPTLTRLNRSIEPKQKRLKARRVMQAG